MRSLRHLLIWPLANIRHHRVISGVSVAVMASAVFLIATLLGFVNGYQSAVREDVDRLGYDLLITAKGCPYEAATLMLRGGVGLKYMPAGVVSRLNGESEVDATFPMLIHPVRNPSTEQGMTLFKGVSPGWFDTMALTLREGEWYDESADGLSGDGVVLGYEAAELETRHVGDPYLLYQPRTKTFVETRVRGVLERTGTQMDGTVILPVSELQARYELRGRLTGVGVKMSGADAATMTALRDRYDLEPELQVISLSKIEEALHKAMDNMRDVVELLAWILALMAAAILLNTTLLRTLSEQRRLYVLHAIGLPHWFIHAAAAIENAILVSFGTGVGLGIAAAAGPASSELLASYLPYAPAGDLVLLTTPLLAGIAAIALGIALLSTIPPLMRLAWFSDLSTLRGGG
jgi:ABC-type lipoprotein release transport system permease subunit